MALIRAARALLARSGWGPFQQIRCRLAADACPMRSGDAIMVTAPWPNVIITKFWGFSRNADEKELKSAFRKLAKQYHPDANPGDKTAEHKFKEINEAYDVLKDPQKKAAYDRFGHAAFEGGMGGGARPARRLRSRIHLLDVGYFRGPVRRLHGRRRAAAAGAAAGAAAARRAVPIFATTWKSASPRPIPARRRRSACRPRSPAMPARARAPSPAPSPKTCPTCGGVGRGALAVQGFFTVERTCPTCQGRGQVISDPCVTCGGAGPRHQRAHALGQHSGRRRGRHAHQACRRRRGGLARRPGRRSLYFPVGQAA